MSIDDLELKSNGFLKQKQENTVLARFRTIAGNLTSDQLRKIAELADTYSKGTVHITSRQGVELYGINIDNYYDIKKEIIDAGLNIGSVSRTLKPIMACPGGEVCKFGLMNTRTAAIELDKCYFAVPVPAKVKMAVTGCPNSCAKPQVNDIGFMGAVEPSFNEEKCIVCGKCVKVCPEKAILKEEGRLNIVADKCVFCGRCIPVCPAKGAREEKRRGYMLYAGGKVGRNPKMGVVIREFVQESEIVPAVEIVLAAFKRISQDGERMADTISRVGAKAFRDEVMK